MEETHIPIEGRMKAHVTESRAQYSSPWQKLFGHSSVYLGVRDDDVNNVNSASSPSLSKMSSASKLTPLNVVDGEFGADHRNGTSRRWQGKAASYQDLTITSHK